MSGDRLIAALVAINFLADGELLDHVSYRAGCYDELENDSVRLVKYMESQGFPPSSEALEEIFDGAPPASVGLNLVDIDWKGQ